MAARTGRNPPEPLVGSDLLTWLDWVNTPRAINPGDTLSSIMHDAGRQAVITQLRELHQKQQARGRAISSDEPEVIEFPNSPSTPYTES